jgi:hypothetical protein
LVSTKAWFSTVTTRTPRNDKGVTTADEIMVGFISIAADPERVKQAAERAKSG